MAQITLQGNPVATIQRFRKNRCDVILGFALNIQGKSFPRPAIVG